MLLHTSPNTKRRKRQRSTLIRVARVWTSGSGTSGLRYACTKTGRPPNDGARLSRRRMRLPLRASAGLPPGRRLVPFLSIVGAFAGALPPRLDPQLEEVLNAVRDGEFEIMAAAIEGGMAVPGRKRFVSWLLERGAAVGDPAQNGITPLNRPSMGGDLGTMELLLQADRGRLRRAGGGGTDGRRRALRGGAGPVPPLTRPDEPLPISTMAAQ